MGSTPSFHEGNGTGYGSGYGVGPDFSGYVDENNLTSTDRLYVLTRNKVITESIQLPITMVTILINFYCLVTIAKTPEIRNMNYFLAALQSIMDLLFSGIISIVYYSLEIASAINKFCGYVHWGLTLTTDEFDNYRFCLNLPSSDAHLNKVSGLLQTILENYPYWAQIFIAVAIALERYIFICHGVKADEYLKEFNRYVLFSITILLSFGIPSLYTLDFVKHVDSILIPTAHICHSMDFLLTLVKKL
ncbi:uncharacterized protein LOC142354412 [Convolutriloba macropyga]|uniref:uncharacterized protein LOC142354412 n=1 Tax=Convolutriloba macropyga TaxID=536237 RepID=UPI003F5200D4